MIQEDYVSFEVAKLLKEKGFDEPCYTCYLNKGLSHYDYLSTNFELIDDIISAPTNQMAMKWLREEYKIDICVFPEHYDYILWGYNCRIYKNKEQFCHSENFKSYEEAVEAALKYCLEKFDLT